MSWQTPLNGRISPLSSLPLGSVGGEDNYSPVRGMHYSSAGFQTCCTADFQVGTGRLPWCARVGKPAIQQTWKSALPQEVAYPKDLAAGKMPPGGKEISDGSSRQKPDAPREQGGETGGWDQSASTRIEMGDAGGSILTALACLSRKISRHRKISDHATPACGRFILRFP